MAVHNYSIHFPLSSLLSTICSKTSTRFYLSSWTNTPLLLTQFFQFPEILFICLVHGEILGIEEAQSHVSILSPRNEATPHRLPSPAPLSIRIERHRVHRSERSLHAADFLARGDVKEQALPFTPRLARTSIFSECVVVTSRASTPPTATKCSRIGDSATLFSARSVVNVISSSSVVASNTFALASLLDVASSAPSADCTSDVISALCALMVCVIAPVSVFSTRRLPSVQLGVREREKRGTRGWSRGRLSAKVQRKRWWERGRRWWRPCPCPPGSPRRLRCRICRQKAGSEKAIVSLLLVSSSTG